MEVEVLGCGSAAVQPCLLVRARGHGCLRPLFLFNAPEGLARAALEHRSLNPGARPSLSPLHPACAHMERRSCCLTPYQLTLEHHFHLPQETGLQQHSFVWETARLRDRQVGFQDCCSAPARMAVTPSTWSPPRQWCPASAASLCSPLGHIRASSLQSQ